MRLPLSIAALLTLLLFGAGCNHGRASPALSPVRVEIGPAVLRTGVKRMGVNLGGQTFYDSGQILRDLTFRNPGFEGGTWQSILHCKLVSATTCTDENRYTVWPAGFLTGGHYEWLSGAAAGSRGSIVSSSAAQGELGVTVELAASATTARSGDFLLVRIDKPGNAQAGWWTEAAGGASFSTETRDLAPQTAGRQALRVDASAPGARALLHSYFDSMEGHSFVTLHGSSTLEFRARALAGSPAVDVTLERLDLAHSRHVFFSRHVPLRSQWQSYRFDIDANESRDAVGTLALTFAFSGTAALLDDVSLRSAAAPDNPTAFRDEVVSTLRELHPGVLRYMDSGTNFGSSLDNMLAVPGARQRAGASTQLQLEEDIPLGLNEFLELAQTIGAEPWYVMPPGTTLEEARHLVEFLAGPESSPYGGVRAELGHPAPWSGSFQAIHLELGNEQWNAASFAGATMADPTAFGQRADSIFRAIRASPWFRPAAFDLVLGTWNAQPWWTAQETRASGAHDSVAIAPYLFDDFNDSHSVGAVFLPMLAQPEAMDSRPGGIVQQQLAALGQHPSRLSVYELNLGTMGSTSGGVSQADVDRTVSSLGAGLAVADHMLLLLRDAGVRDDCLFSLTGYRNNFTSPSGNLHMPLWGAVIDMGGATDRRRPQFLAVQLINQALLANELETRVSANQPLADLPSSPNDKVELAQGHLLESFAFGDGNRRSLVLLNLSLDQALPVQVPAVAGGVAVDRKVLDAAELASNNETAAQVKVAASTLQAGRDGLALSLPAHSMTVLQWQTR